MSPVPERSNPAEVEAHFRELIDSANLDQPDRVEHDPEADELTFFWDDRKAAVIIELGEEGPVHVRPGSVRLEPPV